MADVLFVLCCFIVSGTLHTACTVQTRLFRVSILLHIQHFKIFYGAILHAESEKAKSTNIAHALMSTYSY